MLHLFTNHIWEWLIFSAVLLALTYTLFIIKNEVITYKEDSTPLKIGPIEIDIANWWTLTKQDKNFYYYERTDTRYEWFAKLKYINTQEFEKIQDIFDQYIREEDVYFDEDVVITTEPSHLFLDNTTKDKIIECLRVEGKATQGQTKRIYWDVYLFRIGDEPSYYIFESWSSVLNGMLEGPFFEEAITHLRIT